MVHILIIPDGNRRYANKKGISLDEVYLRASKDVTTTLVKKFLSKKEVDELSIFAIGRNNIIKRPKREIDPIFESHYITYESWLKDKAMLNFKIKFIGDLSLLPKKYLVYIKEIEKKSKTGKVFNILLSYDGQWEIEQAFRNAIKKKSKISANNFKKTLLLQTPLDLIIRTGGEQRLSSCPLYQAAYTELYFCDFLYPEFTVKRVEKILKVFKKRNRRYGT